MLVWNANGDCWDGRCWGAGWCFWAERLVFLVVRRVGAVAMERKWLTAALRQGDFGGAAGSFG